MIESDVGLIRLIVLAALSSSLALNGQKILCGHSCVLKHRTRESRTDMQQALGVAMGSECFPVVYGWAQLLPIPGSTIAVDGMICLLAEMLGRCIWVHSLLSGQSKGVRVKGSLVLLLQHVSRRLGTAFKRLHFTARRAVEERQ